MKENKFYNEVGWIKNSDTAQDMARIEDKGHPAAPKGKIEKAVNNIKKHFPSEKAKLECAQKEADEYEKIRLEQFRLGENIFNELTKAAESNKTFNVLDGNHVEGIGPLRVAKVEDNGGGYSIFIVIDATGSTQGNYPVYQIDVRLKNIGKEIHTHEGAFGKDENYAKQAVALLVEKLAKEVSEYRLYKDEK